MVKLKPLLDAYQGPYKDTFRYWTGMMLVVRIGLFTVLASNILGDVRVNLASSNYCGSVWNICMFLECRTGVQELLDACY